MDLMQNKYLNFSITDYNGLKIRNSTELNLLPEIPSKYFGVDFILETQIDNNKLLESISWDLYENTDYWDILMKLNGIVNTNELPVDYDNILIRVRNKMNTWINTGKLIYTNNITSQFDELILLLDSNQSITLNYDINDTREIVKRKYLEMIDTEVILNEKFRNFKYISLGNMVELERELSILKETPKINDLVLINPPIV